MFCTCSIEFWKYVVTLTDDNELMLWSCETWESLQKLKFIRGSATNNPMKLTVDETGRFIFLSDIDNNVIKLIYFIMLINRIKVCFRFLFFRYCMLWKWL